MSLQDLIGSVESLPWMRQGRCGDPDVDPGIFFPSPGQSLRPAKAICKGCPVRVACGEYAIENPALEGVWGGLSGFERGKLRRERDWTYRQTHCRKAGHPLEGDNVRIGKDGSRTCLKCERVRMDEYTARRRHTGTRAAA